MDEQVNVKQIFVLVAGLALIFFWFKTNHPKAVESVTVPVVKTEASERLLIPKISVDAPIIFADSTDEAVIEAGLETGIVHLKDTAMPGEIGNAYIVGHSSDYLSAPGKYKTIFAQLPKLAAGDGVTIRKGEQELDFKVTQTRIVEANDLSVLSQATDGKRLMTLQTSYPVGTAEKRFIVIAELIK